MTAGGGERVGWSMRTALIVLGIADRRDGVRLGALRRLARGLRRALGLSDFFVAAVIVAIVGNAAEHGGAIVVARRGKTKLASEIAISSSAQVAVFVAPAAALPRSSAARPAARVPAGRARDRRAGDTGRDVRRPRRPLTRKEGIALVAGYGGAVAAYAIAG